MIVSCGEALVDVFEGGLAVPGGGPMNAAITAARLGVPTAFLGRVSTDAHGDEIWAHMSASNVDLRVAERGDEPTARAVVTTTPVQSFRFEGTDTADTMLESADLTALGAGPHTVHGGTLGIFRGRSADAYLGLLRASDGLISFDPNIRPQIIDDVDHWWRYANRWLDRADIIRGSDEDFDWMGLSIAELLQRGPAVVLRTVGAAGVEAFFADGSSVQVPGATIEFVDAVGAGDSFCGAVLTQLEQRGVTTRPLLDELDHRAWIDILSFAVNVAGITCSRSGANPPWANELGE
ncbi:MAG: carbohydrate kinase [Acidimicrobiales bacterium]